MSTTLYIAGTARQRAGGWAFILEEGGKTIRSDSGGAWDVTSPRMDLTALVTGLDSVQDGGVEVVLTSDALLRTAVEWMPKWRAARWKRKKGGAIRNLDLVKRLATHTDRLVVRWQLSNGKETLLQDAKEMARAAGAKVDRPAPEPSAPPVTGTVGPSEKRLVAYTDGGCRGNPGVGGWGFLMVDTRSGAALSKRGGARETTNNRMEMQAAIEAMAALNRPGMSLEIRTDSRYLRDVATSWLRGWKKNNWKKKTGQPIKNVDLVQRIDILQNKHDVTWTWVKGHAGEPGNEFADHLTNAAMDEVRGGKSGIAEQRYKVSPIRIHKN